IRARLIVAWMSKYWILYTSWSPDSTILLFGLCVFGRRDAPTPVFAVMSRRRSDEFVHQSGSLHRDVSDACCDVGLPGTSTRPLASDHDTPLEDLATPDTPWLAPLDGPCKALHPDGAIRTKRLCKFQLSRRVREPKVRVKPAARHVNVQLDLRVEGR